MKTTDRRDLESTGQLEIWPNGRHASAARIRLLLIDDHSVVREGLAALLSLELDLEVVGTASAVAEGITLIANCHPDLVVSDLNMPGCTGGAAVRRLIEAFPSLRVLVLSVNESRESIRAAFSAGAAGYVRKDAARDEVLSAIRRVAAGDRFTCRAVGDTIVKEWLERDGTPAAAEGADLSADERRVLRLIALGVPTWQIAEQLGRGLKAVEKFRAQLMRRLGLANAAAVTRYAVKLDLLSHSEVDRLLNGVPVGGTASHKGTDGEQHTDH